jgi:hypothetical protein
MNTSECVAEEIRKRIGVRQPEHRLALRTNEMSGCEKELSAQSLQSGALKARGRAQPLEPSEQVVSQQDELKEYLCAAEILHRNFVERIGGLELSNDKFGPGAIVVGRGRPRSHFSLRRPPPAEPGGRIFRTGLPRATFTSQPPQTVGYRVFGHGSSNHERLLR